MRRFLLTLLAGVSLTPATTALAATITEIEGNDSLATGQLIDGNFTLDYRADIGDHSTNTSTTIPHVSIEGDRFDGSFDYYIFNVAVGGTKGIFDIDYDLGDPFLDLYTIDGTRLIWDDDSYTSYGQGGSTTTLESYLEYTFASAGTYAIRVGNCCDLLDDGAPADGPYEYNPPYLYTGQEGASGTYVLQVSLEAPAAAVPEPASWALMLGGFGMIGSAVRRSGRRAIAA